jgi:peptidoglycan/LPS O-acetylase OafA/YrhL
MTMKVAVGDARRLNPGTDKENIDDSFWSLLAGLRFFFAVWVLFNHTANFGLADRSVPFFTDSGFGAVFCFFVISGFSIHHSISRQSNGYIRRRILRIYPVNAVAVAIAWISYSLLGLKGAYAVPPEPPGAWIWVCNLLLLQGIFQSGITILFPSWSIALEALYYWAAPWLKKISLGFVSTLAVMSFALQLFGPYLWPDVSFGIAYGLAAITLSWGWLAGWIAYMRPRYRPLYALAFIAAGCVYMSFQPTFFAIVDFKSGAINYLAWSVTVAVVFFRLNLRITAKIAGILNYLGDISFPLYMIHYPVMYLLTSSFLKSHPKWNHGFVLVIACLAASAAVLHFIDRPLRSWGKRASRTPGKSINAL